MKTNDIQISLPASKSLSNRWLMLNHVAGGTFQLMGLSASDDTQLLRQLLAQLPTIDILANSVVNGTLPTSSNAPSPVLYCHNAGTVARFLTALTAITPGSFMITGDERLCQRPISDLVESLVNMGCNIQYARTPGQFPLQVIGTQPRRKMAYISSLMSSQFVSALLLIAPALPHGMRITLTSKSTSRPYIDMTLEVLRQAGISVETLQSGRIISVASLLDNRPKRKAVTIERDWTSASYFFQIAALCPNKLIRLVSLSPTSVQGDAILLEMFQSMGVKSTAVRSPYRRDVNSIRIQGGHEREKHFKANFRHCPDILPAVLVTLAALGMRATLTGIQNLRLKESDRIQALITELSDMGVRIRLSSEDTLQLYASTINPTRPVHTYGDHRIVMAFAPLKLIFPDLQIEHPELVSKSFPNFWQEFEKCSLAPSNL